MMGQNVRSMERDSFVEKYPMGVSGFRRDERAKVSNDHVACHRSLFKRPSNGAKLFTAGIFVKCSVQQHWPAHLYPPAMLAPEKRLGLAEGHNPIRNLIVAFHME